MNTEKTVEKIVHYENKDVEKTAENLAGNYDFENRSRCYQSALCH